MKKILIAFGTRPEAIKMAPLIFELKKYPDIFEIKVCVTAQHREMLDQVLNIFHIEPDYDLDIMKSGQDLYDITSTILLEMRSVLNQFQPEVVFVHGDTTTTIAVALASFYQKISVAHIEAGLRTGDIYSPWPEEANRKLTSQITKWHFAPTVLSQQNLEKENIKKEVIMVTGNTVIDGLMLTIKNIQNDAELKQKIEKKWTLDFDVGTTKIILVTSHRRENFGLGVIEICKALHRIALSKPDVQLVFPVHLNPNIRKPVQEILSNVDNVSLLEPMDYQSFVYLMSQAYLVLTDSGGIQEEAPSLGKPVLVMRETTERPEAVEAGTVSLVGSDQEKIVQSVLELLEDDELYQKMSQAHNPYGDGCASQRIVEFLLQQ